MRLSIGQYASNNGLEIKETVWLSSEYNADLNIEAL